MDAAKKQRKALRTSFTKALNAFTAKMDVEGPREEKMVAFQFLETKMAELDTVHSMYNQLLFQSDANDDTIMKELESDDLYKTNFITAKMKMVNLTPTTSVDVPRTVSNAVHTAKLPKLELPKFSGMIKEWLPFWSQFKKIHDDPAISNEDKFQYLQQATLPDSRAKEIVQSFPPTGENYVKAITSLKNRFGREDIIVEFYVRELLGLVLQNAVKGPKKASLASVYDKLECYIRALETLGVTTDRCAAMLYPLVESSLPEEVLRAWQRSGRERPEDNEGREITDRLSNLLKFLQREVENEERIDMALTGFGLPAEQAKKQKSKIEAAKETPSASVLLVSKDPKPAECIFCKSSHESQVCENARKLTLDERKEIVKKERCCFNCLKRGHVSQKCKVKLRCDWCSRRHVLVMCPGIVRKENVPPNKPENKDPAKTTEEHSLATLCEMRDVYLQTLRVKLYSQSREKIVRAVIDTASQRSYIRTDVARELGYVSLGKQEISHSLFGGVKSECKTHDVFLIRLKNLDDSYACNFSVMDQETICSTIQSIRKDKWVDELRDQNIHLTDIGENSSSIDVLIGADVAGKLITGRKYDLKNGLIVFETRLGWTVIGKLPKESQRVDAAVMITTLFVQEANISDLWRLDVVGISDPIEKASKLVREEQTREFLKQTAKLNEEGRYEVRLPWVEDHAPVASNYNTARLRLKKCIERLTTQRLLKAYDEVFKQWLSEGIIERVPDKEVNDLGHYLPHRPVVKTHGTTKIRPVFDASACNKGYPSLNQCLEKGPNLIELVPSALNKFREGEIGVVSDIKKAFLQIVINKTDRDHLRFFWIVNNEIVIFRHCRVVFGLTCSPFLLAAIIELHLSNVKKNPELIAKLKGSFYVDNCVTSVNSEDELKTFREEATSAMASGGFELRGWESSGDLSENETTLVLGVLWNKGRDTIAINPAILKSNYPEVVTKREILSTTHKVFDPIGFTCPASLLPKLLLKELWTEKIDWDTEITDSRKDRFLYWLKELPMLNTIEISRKLGR
ncbi:uncharacterized protein LOC112459126, partial [Temnothorax curvispinosus]|uniref:Uncharacterized protein LOC112459126 n=1 Tax=Temnothorax curvispinosus TaxID=300111 RepID=A0A6J1QDS0_9HYME